jgi:hypothetical protein|tara:strand:+ start:8662 stop:9318 length:657 start_codon:yes stop_codon:yes gene_type:complete
MSNSSKATGGICLFPSPFVFWSDVDNHKEIKKNILPLVLEDIKTNGDDYIKNSNWECDIISSFHTYGENMGDINQKLMENTGLIRSIWDAYNDMIFTLKGKEVIDEYVYDSYCDCVLYDIWYNKYNVDHHQDIHEHSPFEFSGIYILDDPEYSNTYFFDHSSVFKVEGRHTFSQQEAKDFDIREGSIIIFPGALPHHVPTVKSEKITLSFNFKLNSSP